MSHIYDVSLRFWDELISRPSGPLAFRFILQPVMASIMAVRDGVKDAHANRSPYLWTIISDPTRRSQRLHEGIVAVARVLILGVVMDIIYQIIELHGLRPVETIVITLTLGFVPYLVLRGPVARLVKQWSKRSAADHDSQYVPRG
jgi:hypothetical protein